MVSEAVLGSDPSVSVPVDGAKQSDREKSGAFSFFDVFAGPSAEKGSIAVAARIGEAVGASAIKHLPQCSLADQCTGSDTKSGAIGEDPVEAKRTPPELATSLEVVRSAREHFSQFDLDGNGFITEKELAKQVEDPKHTGLMAQTVAAFYGTYSKMDLSADADSRFGVSAGISLADLDKVEHVIKEKQSKGIENTLSAEYLDSLDVNNDRRLQSCEINKALMKDVLPDDEKELFEYFIKNEEMEHPVKISDVLHYFSSKKLGDKEDALLSRMNFLIRHVWENQHNETNLFAEGQENDGISLYGIQQGIMGDCYLLASIAAVAEMTPETIKNMVVDNKDGTYTVTFPGDKNEPQTVSAPTEAELGLYNGSTENGVWGSVIEKAYGQWCQKSFTRRTPLNWTGGLTTAEGADGGGWHLNRVLHLLTGEDADQDWNAFTFNSTTRRKLIEHVNGENKVPVVAWQRWFREFGVSGVANHVYSVLDFNPEGKDGGTVTLYNPWGHKESITFKQFTRRFTAFAYRDR
jgi:hypothetical protein